MGHVVVFTQAQSIGFEQYPDRPLEAGEVRLRTLYSGISAGTEITTYRGSNPYLHKQWDAERRLFVPGDGPSLRYPVSGWGYEEVGEVVERGPEVEGVNLGDLVFGVWGHRTHHIVDADYARGRILPESLDPILGVFSQIGAIALNGVHDARIRIGETVAVFGLGVPGQIVSQLARKSGARVIGVDLMEKRLAVAQESGAVDVALDAREGEVAEEIKALTKNRGADVALEVSGSSSALNEAIRSVAYSSKVVTLGFFQGEAKGLRLGEEFHHNRVNVVCSQISGVDPELTYRWNRERLAQRFMELQAERVISLHPIISHVIPLASAAEAFRLLDKEPERTLQVVLDMRGSV
jgi:2-desacetyl-2-hydroxyethyl bacteriochlorophyllide A dehydrogenase